MSFQNINSAVVVGLEAFKIDIEVNIDNRGFPSFDIVGLAAKEINEAKERVKAAIRNSDFKFPAKKILVNLAPADMPKKGALYDLPIAVGILAATGLINIDLNKFLFAGELSLDGTISEIKGTTLIAIEAKSKDKILVIPEKNLPEVGLIEDLKILSYKNLKDLVTSFLRGNFVFYENVKPIFSPKAFNYLLENISGHDLAKRALTIAALGRHSICLIGSAGSGKTIIARTIESISPNLNEGDLLEVMKITSITGEDISLVPKFRSPNHPISVRNLLGGGNPFALGEITLAHKGILFLDEVTEFENKIANTLRQPVEDKEIKFYTKRHQITLPCDFMLIISANPCPCGNFGDPDKKCLCNPSQINRYAEKLKNPLMDRIDIFINVFSVSSEELLSKEVLPTSASVKNLVTQLRSVQITRAENLKLKFKPNADLSSEEIRLVCKLDEEAVKTMNSLHKKFSSRTIHKIMKVSRTIADLEESEIIKNEHVLEAIQYKSFF